MASFWRVFLFQISMITAYSCYRSVKCRTVLPLHYVYVFKKQKSLSTDFQSGTQSHNVIKCSYCIFSDRYSYRVIFKKGTFAKRSQIEILEIEFTKFQVCISTFYVSRSSCCLRQLVFILTTKNSFLRKNL